MMLNIVIKLNANNQSIGSQSVLLVFLSLKMKTISALPPSWSIQTPLKFRAAQKCPRSSDMMSKSLPLGPESRNNMLTGINVFNNRYKTINV